MTRTLRFLTGIVGVVALLMACAPSAAPPSTAVPPKPAAPTAPTPAQPVATTAPAAAATAAPAAKPPTAPAKVVEVGGAFGNNLNHVPIMVGVEKGVFLKNGLDLKLKLFSSGQEMQKMAQAGQAKFLGSAISNLPVAIYEGFPAVSVVGLLGDTTNSRYDQPVAIVARKESNIKTVADLVGKKVAAGTGTTGDQYLRALLAKNNIPVDRVTIQPAPVSESLAVLSGGGVDAVAVWEPWTEQVLAKVPGSYIVQRGGGLIGYFIMAQTLESVVQQEPELVQAFVDGVAEAAFYTRGHLDEAATIFNHWVPGLDDEITKKAIKHMAFDTRLNKGSAKAWDESVQLLIEQKKLKAPVPAEKVVLPRFVEKTMKDHPEWFKDLPPVQ